MAKKRTNIERLKLDPEREERGEEGERGIGKKKRNIKDRYILNDSNWIAKERREEE